MIRTMLRMLIKIFGCVCIAAVISELAVLGVMWKRGLLSEHNLREIKMVLATEHQEAGQENTVARQSNQPSLAQVTEVRAVRLFEFDRREGQLQAMKTMADDQAADLEQRLREFRGHKKTFEEGLATLQKNIASQASEQARGVLLALPPKDAVEKLMILSLSEDVLLLKGMTEKSIARILAEFNASPEQVERGRKIFEAISRGDPARAYVNDEARKSVAELKPANTSNTNQLPAQSSIGP